MINLISPENGSTVSLQTDIQHQFFRDIDKRLLIEDTTDFRWYAPEMRETDQSCPAPVEFAWENDIEANAPCLIIISEKSDLSDPIIKVAFENNYKCYNLCIGKKYYWCVQKNGFRSDTGYFFTADETPRGICIDGLSNVRDIGGYKVPGGCIRQGLIYRGCAPDEKVVITEKGVNDFLQLGIRTQIDLRGGRTITEMHSVFEAYGIKRIFIPIGPYTGIFKADERKLFHDCFKAFSQKSLYPIYFNCVAGADRTGSIALLLEAFLGVEYSQVIDDYEYTSLSKWSVRTRNHIHFIEMLDELNKFDGNTFQEKVTDYLKSFLKLTDKQLNNIKEILIEPNN